MYIYFLILFISFVITASFTPLAKKIAFKANIFDNPGNCLKIHKKPTPYLGGLAIFAGFFISLSAANILFTFNQLFFWGLIIATTIITCIGLIDDIKDLKQILKFILQIILALGLVLIGMRVNVFPTMYIAIPLTIFYVVGACNALNLLDGLDGLAAGVSAISSLFFFILFLENHDIFGIALSLSLLGACGAFLLYNYLPASIFMGDSGSMLLGIVMSILMIRYSEPYDYKSLFIPILVCGIPIFDTALAYTRRYINNKPIFPGDRSHFYDQLVDRGFSVKQTVFISYSIGILFGIIALIMTELSEKAAVIVFSIVIVFLAIIIWKMKFLKMQDESHCPRLH